MDQFVLIVLQELVPQGQLQVEHNVFILKLLNAQVDHTCRMVCALANPIQFVVKEHGTVKPVFQAVKEVVQLVTNGTGQFV